MQDSHHTKKHARLPGKLVIIGCGSVAKAVMPLLFRHLVLSPQDVTVVTADDEGRAVVEGFGVKFIRNRLTRENLRAVLHPLVGKNDFVLNLSVNVSSRALIRFCQERGALYLDSCIEPWEGGYTDPALSLSERSNYALRENALALRKEFPNGPTAVVAYGANPGMVSQFTKQALINIAKDVYGSVEKPQDRAAWGALAKKLGVSVIHIAERDTQVASTPKQVGEFVNTWSVDGFVGEGTQPAELGWGTHEKSMPSDGQQHDFGSLSAIYLTRPGASVRVRSWTPTEGPYHGFLITHNESIAISDYYSVKENGKVVYRPTVHYAYHPCDEAVMSIHELAGKNWIQQPNKRILMDEVISGYDELGVLLMGHPKGAYWYGSHLTTDEARRLAPHNNATSLQIATSVLAGVVWAIENPSRSIVEADDMDFERHMEISLPYLGKMIGQYTDWSPLKDRSPLFKEEIDHSDPWQFQNFRV